jgi:hypothetical protein
MQAAETLMHELMHVVWRDHVRVFDNNYVEIQQDEEFIVDRMALGVTGILRLNPRLRKWLDDCLL